MKEFFIPIIIVLAIFFTVGLTQENRFDYHTETEYITKNKTYWSYAIENCPSDMDLRQYVDIMEQENGNKDLVAGDTVKIIIVDKK